MAKESGQVGYEAYTAAAGLDSNGNPFPGWSNLSLEYQAFWVAVEDALFTYYVPEKKDPPQSTQTVQPSTGQEGAIEPMLVNPVPVHWNQADPRWAKRYMGTDMTFKRGACGICSIAMQFDWIYKKFGQHDLDVTPVELDDWMDKNQGYLAGTNMLVWDRMVNFAAEVLGETLIYRQIGSKANPLEHEEGLEEARQIIQQNWPVILRVKYRATRSQQWFNHFVLGVGVNQYGEIRFLDPGTAIGGDLSHAQNDTGQTTNKGGYDIVAIEYFGRESVS